MKNKIRELILKNNINISLLSEKTGIGRTTLYQIKNEKSIPNIEYALKLAKYFNVKVDELFILENE